MLSPKLLALLVAKEWRELMASRAYWLLLVFIGPLVGNSFITAVNLYAEASGIGGGAAALAQGLTPLDGILVPTWGAYDLAVTLLERARQAGEGGAADAAKNDLSMRA